MMRGRYSQCRRRAGYTLVEIAVVTGLAGVVLGAIWVAGAAAYQRKVVNDIERDMRVIAANAINLYGGSGVNNAAGGSGYVSSHYATEVEAGIFPGDFLNSTVTDSIAAPGGGDYIELPTAWGYMFWDGYYQQNMIVGGAASTTFVYEEDLINIPDDICTQFVMDFSDGKTGGVIDIMANTTEWGSIYGGTTPFVNNIPASQASKACYSAGANTSQVWIIFGTTPMG